MAKRMLIDAAHPEETRVVVTSGHRLEEFDFESSTKKQVKGNIYLAKVTRVEPSLQAAFVDYGGNRHGFLAFSEIHPDYYRIPVSDRQFGEADPEAGELHPGNGGDDSGVPIAAALPEPVPVRAEAAGDEEPAGDSPSDESAASPDYAEEERGFPAEAGSLADPDARQPFQHEFGSVGGEQAPGPIVGAATWPEPAEDERAGEISIETWSSFAVAEQPAEEPAGFPSTQPGPTQPGPVAAERDQAVGAREESGAQPGDVGVPDDARGAADTPSYDMPESIALRAAEESLVAEPGEFAEARAAGGEDLPADERHEHAAGAASVETLGGDEEEDVEEADAERRRSFPTRHYKIQEVIKRRQIMLVQVAKEERGNKGAALTTYLSLAGRYCVLMPNTNRGGGVSRKITSIADRRRLKDILEDLDIPEGMGVIVRTAGAERSKAEIKRDYEYLLRLWNEIRDLTLNSTAPALIYEEGNLIKRSIRDLYTRDIDEVLVEGEEGYKTAKAFMRTLMPSHAKRVQPYRDPQVPLFQRFQIENQIDAIHSPVAQLRSGGYIVINQTEALVSIDVNSGRSTRERNIEETAVRTNLEAADEIARQLRLRDLAGLIVIDFIDMEEHRNQVAVERRLKEALKNDRARIQVGRISPFGLLEMSRQRLRPSLTETSTQPCPHCGGTGFIRSVESTALYVLRSIEEEGIRRRSAEICIYVPTNVALYILNQKRESLAQIEARYGIRVTVARDDSLIPPSFRLDRLRAFGVGEAPPLRAIQAPILPEEDDEEETAEPAEAVEAEGEDERRGSRRRRRRRPPRRGEEARSGGREREPRTANGAAEPGGAAAEEGEALAAREEEDEGERPGEAERRRRRRGRRGGRVRPRREDAGEAAAAPSAEMIEVVPVAAVAPEADAGGSLGLETWPAEMAPSAGDVDAQALAPLAGEGVEPAIDAHAADEGEPAGEPEEPHGGAPEPAPSAEAEPGVPFDSESVRRFEESAAEPAMVSQNGGAELAPPPNEDVLIVTEKPANPRRGWWRRPTQA